MCFIPSSSSQDKLTSHLPLTFPLGHTVATDGPSFPSCKVMLLNSSLSLCVCAVALFYITKATPSVSNGTYLNIDWATEFWNMIDCLIVLRFACDFHPTRLIGHVRQLHMVILFNLFNKRIMLFKCCRGDTILLIPFFLRPNQIRIHLSTCSKASTFSVSVHFQHLWVTLD